MGAQPRQLSAVLNQALCKAKIQQLEDKDTLLELIEVLTPEEFSKVQLLMPEDTNGWSSTLLVSCAKSIDCVSQTVKPSIYSQFVEILLRRFDPRDSDKDEIQIEEFLQQCTLDLPSEFAEMKLRDIFDQVKLIQIMGNKSRSLFTWNESKTSAELIMITKTHYLSQRSVKQEPKDAKESRKTKDDAVSSKDRVCYECQEKGHMKPDCPKLKKPTTTKVAKIRRNADDFNTSPVKGQMFQFAVPGETPIYHEAYLDTMAEITVISLATWEKLGSPKLSKTNHQLVGAGEVPLETEGIVTLTIKAQGKEATIDVVVMKNQDSCLMDPETYLKFFDGFNCAMLKRELSTEMHISDTVINEYLRKNVELWNDILQEPLIKVKYQTVDNVEYIVSKPRRMHPDTVPPAIEYITKEIAANRMEEVHFPKMASPGVLVIKKDQSLRLCLSAERINHNFIHIPLNLPSLNDIQSLISDTSISWKFTTLDMKSAYRLIGLDEQSSEFTTVSLPFGYFKSKCLVYGIAQSGVLFYNTIKNLLKDVPRSIIYMDDILIVTPEHDSSPILQTLQILQQHRLKINIHKSFFLQDSVMYLSYEVSNEGIRMNSEVANQLARVEKPTTATELRSLKGKLSYLRNFIGPGAAVYDKELSDMSEGLWSPKKDATLKKVQIAIREAKILNFFNPSTESLSLQTWSEKEILAGILWGKNINTNEYSLLNTFSRVMVKSEQNYPFIEKQALAAKEALFYFESFTRIHVTTLEIPDKTLVHMFKKRNVCANAQYSRILRWSLEMEEFPHDVVYRDLHEKVSQLLNLNNHVKTTKIQSIQKAESWLQQKASTDAEYQQLLQVVVSGDIKNLTSPYQRKFQQFWNLLTIQDGVLYVSDKPVLPKSAYQDVIDDLHKQHFAVTNMLRRVRNMFVAVSLRKWIVATHMKCDLCQRYGSSRPRTIHSWPSTTSNNQRWHMDIGTVNQVSFLACVDVHCNWIMAARIKNHTPSEITKKLLLFFEHNGCSLFLVSDNFPSFKDVSFCTLLKGKGITPFYSPSYTPQSNGSIERCMKILKDGMAKSSLSTFDQRLQEAIINHHTGSTDVEGKSPTQRRLQVFADYHIINDISYEKAMDHLVWFKTPNMSSWEEGTVIYQLSKDIFIIKTKEEKEIVIKGCHLKDRLKTETAQIHEANTTDPKPHMTSDSPINSEPIQPILLHSHVFQLRGGEEEKNVEISVSELIESNFKVTLSEIQKQCWDGLSIMKVEETSVKNLLFKNITDKTFVDEKIKELENVKMIAASDGSSGKDSLGKAILVELRIQNDIYHLQGSLEGKKVHHLERDLTHMDMELEALLFNAIITHNMPAICIVDSEALIPMWENLMNTDKSEEPRSRRRRILDIVKQCELEKTSIMWLPRNSIILMDEVDKLAKNA